MTPRETYDAKLGKLSRHDLLRLCRIAGFSAHHLTENAELIELLWQRIGRHRYERNAERKA